MSPLSKIVVFFHQRLLFFGLVTYGLWLSLLLITSVITIYNLRQAALTANYERLLQASSQSQTALKLLKFSTLNLIPDLDFAYQAVSLPTNNFAFLYWLEQLHVDPFLPTESPLSPKNITELTDQLQQLSKSCTKTWFLQWLFNHQLCQKLSAATNLEQTLAPFITQHLEADHTYIILFQNSDELRASGGFMGSFAKIVVGAQGLSYLEIQDIYEPDGQFTGFVSAPPGVAEYLSSGNGLRLPDANWAADFPTAAQTILNYFSFGKQQSIDGVVAINSTLIEKLLMITGDVYLPDYKTNVSASTFSTLARADRDQFFPGSKQKQHFLTSFMTQLKLRLKDLSPSQQQALLELITSSVASKDILTYSTNPELQAVLEQHHLTGSLLFDQTTNTIYLLESNVGINKANKNITRRVDLTQTGDLLEITIVISNQNNDLDYANYQRLIVPTSWQLTKLTINGTPMTTWHEDTLTPTASTSAKQLGFLVGVPANQESTITVSLAGFDPTTNLTVIKQPGLPPTPYHLIWHGQTTDFILDQDITLPLPL